MIHGRLCFQKVKTPLCESKHNSVAKAWIVYSSPLNLVIWFWVFLHFLSLETNFSCWHQHFIPTLINDLILMMSFSCEHTLSWVFVWLCDTVCPERQILVSMGYRHLIENTCCFQWEVKKNVHELYKTRGMCMIEAAFLTHTIAQMILVYYGSCWYNPVFVAAIW